MKSTALVFAFFFLTYLLLSESFENNKDLILNDNEKIVNLQLPGILNDEEDGKFIKKRQNGQRRRNRRRRRQRRLQNQAFLNLTQQIANLQTQIIAFQSQIASRLASLSTTSAGR